MNISNDTQLLAGAAMATDKTGRDWLVVVVKGTYGFPAVPGEEPRLVEEQAPLVMTDEFTGEPGFSAPRYECEFALRKPRCDVLLNGSAYAPGGKPTQRVTAGLRVGTLAKSFDVVGNRVFREGVLATSVSQPEPFTVLPISYNNAFGGIDRSAKDESKHRWHPLNHAGVGFHAVSLAKLYDGQPLPNTEETGRPINQPSGNYRPMALGAVGRSWQPRVKWAGVYDQRWLDNKFPFLPDDFDDRYFQAAPDDQQIDFPRGGEEVTLLNLTPQGRTEFRLPPRLDLAVLFRRREGGEAQTPAVVDTIIIEPDLRRFSLVWRSSLALRRNMCEINEAIVVFDAAQWRRRQEAERRRSGKRRFASLAELVASSGPRRGPLNKRGAG